MQRWMLGAIVGAALALALGLLTRSPKAPMPQEETQLQPAEDTATNTVVPAMAYDNEDAPTEFPPLPADRQGTEVDGTLTFDATGHLVLTPDVRHVFDYFLMSVGAETPATIEARLFAHLHAALPPTAAAEGHALWRKYMAMRADFANVAPDPSRTHGQNAVDALEELTAKHFTPREREVLFGDELTRARAAAPALDALEASPTMAKDERQQVWDAATERMPASERDARTQAMRLTTYLASEQQLLQAGGGVEDVQLMRRRTLGDAAASRLAKLDVERARWRNRLEAYKSDRERILADESLTTSERDAKVEALLDDRFSEMEQIRVRALLRGN